MKTFSVKVDLIRIRIRYNPSGNYVLCVYVLCMLIEEARPCNSWFHQHLYEYRYNFILHDSVSQSD